RADRGGPPPLPANSHARRLRPSPSPRRSVPPVGGGVFSPLELGHESDSRARGGSGGAAVKVLTHPELVRLHPTGHHPDTPRRLEALLDSVEDWSQTGPAAPADIQRGHTPDDVQHIPPVPDPPGLTAAPPASGP